MHRILNDFRLAVRGLRTNPGLSAVAVIAFTLGLGLVTMVYSIVDGALGDLPFEDPDRLLHIERRSLDQRQVGIEVPFHDFVEYRERQTTFESLAAFHFDSINLAGDGERPERFRGAVLTANTFDALGNAEPHLGRTFLPGDDEPGAPRLAILGHHVWEGRFGSDPGIVGRTVRLNGAAHQVVGVMEEGFRFPINHDLWTNLNLDPDLYERGDGRTLEVFGRLKEGVSVAEARADLAAVAAGLADRFPESNEAVGVMVKPYGEEFIGEEAVTLLGVMLAAVFGVLLIACANVANLLLARSATRSKEVAVRSALGAGRFAIIRQILVEVLVLALVGAVLGTLLAAVGVQLFNASIGGTNPPYWLDIRIDFPVLAFVGLVTLIGTLAAGLLPALRSSGEGLGEVLKDSSRGSSSLRMGRLSRVLVVTEIALSCGLLVASGLMIKTVINLSNTDFGIQQERVLTSRVVLPAQTYEETADRRRFFDELDARISALPGVEAAALGSGLPVEGSWRMDFELEGEAPADPDEKRSTRFVQVTPGYFDVFSVKVLSGRTFTAADREGNLPVALVNRSFAASHFPETDPVGKRIRIEDDGAGDPWRTIVGVVPDLFVDGPQNEFPQGVYIPLAQGDARGVRLIQRTAGPPLNLIPLLARTVEGLDRDLPVFEAKSMDDLIYQQTWFYGVFGTLFMVFGLSALFLASVGLYGVMAFSVSRRTHEVGIRMALGAKASQVLGMVLRQGGWQIGIGIVLGLALASLITRSLEFILFEVNPWDPVVFTGIVAVLAVTGLLACWVPARRAARLSPVEALRQE